MWRYGLLFWVAVVTSLALAPAVARLAVALGAVDVPGDRRIHLRPVPRLGGLAVYASMVVTFALIFAANRLLGTRVIDDPVHLLTIGFGATIVLALGIVDDVRSLSPGIKFGIQLLAALIVVAGGQWISSFLGIELGAWGVVVTVFWVVGVTNAFNLIDGLDGLAAGVAFIVSLTLLAVGIYTGRAAQAMVLAGLAGALAGFLRYNFHPARIFLGDSGSLFVGFLLAVLSIEASSKLSATVAILVPILALGLPIMDTLLAILRRLLRAFHVVRREEGSERYEFFFAGSKSVFTADRAHIHHRLLDLGLTHRNAVLVLWGVTALLCAGAFAAISQHEPNVGLLLAAFTIATVIGIRRLGYGEIRVLRNGALLPVFDSPLVNQRMLHVVVDLGFVVASLLAAYLVWFEGSWSGEVRERFFDAVPVVAFSQIAGFWLAGLYRGSYRYTALPDVFVIARALALAIAGGWVARWVMRGFEPPILGVTILDAYFLATFIGGSRISFRVLEYLFKRDTDGGRRVLVYGAGNGGTLALREIQGNPGLGMRVVGFLDDDPRKRMRTIHGCPIFGPEQLEEMIADRVFDELVVSTPKIGEERLREVAERCAVAGLPARRFTIGWDELAQPDSYRLTAPLD